VSRKLFYHLFLGDYLDYYRIDHCDQF